MKTVIINRKKYTVEYVFNMVGNFYFTDKNNVHHLVDGEDVQEWAEYEGVDWTDGITEAIKYARYYAQEHPDGVFWWTIK